MLLCVPQVRADEDYVYDYVTVNDGIATDQNIPFDDDYMDGAFVKSQFIYPSDMLVNLRGKALRQMTFFATGDNDFGDAEVEIRMGITDADEVLTAFQLEPETLCYKGRVVFSNQKWTVTFNDPFEYPAEGGNLLVQVKKTHSGTAHTMLFYGTENTIGASRYKTGSYEYTLGFLPKLQFQYRYEVREEKITVNKIAYTLRDIGHGNAIVAKAEFKESDLVLADFDITYSSTVDGTPSVSDYFNYRHRIDVPETMTAENGDTYNIIAVLADAFDGNNLTNKVRINVPVEFLEGVSHDANVIIRLDGTSDRIHCNGNDYYCSKAYKVNTEDEDITITERPFGEQMLKVHCADEVEVEMEEESHIYKSQSGVKWNYDKAGLTELNGTDSHNLIARLGKDEVTITPEGINVIRVANNATFTGTLDLTDCNELTFQFATSDDEDARAYPDCRFTEDIALGDNTKVNVEMSLNNQEYYYFSLPFDCDTANINVVDSKGNRVQRSYSIDAAVNSVDESSHYFVLLEWNENKYIDSTTNAYSALNRQATKMDKNKGYVIVIVESYESWAANHDTVLTATATFMANNDYRELVSQEDVTIDTKNSDPTRTNPYSGWNLVGNPYYNFISGSQYSYRYVQKIFHDNGTSAYVRDFVSEIPALSADIRPFEAVFIQHSGYDDLVVSAGAPVQQIHSAPAALPEYITITIGSNDMMIDRTTIINNVDASDKYVMGEDLVKGHLSSNEIYTRYSNTDFSFNKMDIGKRMTVIPVGVRLAEAGDYTIALSEELTNFKVGNVVLHDKKLGTYYNLSNGESETLHLENGATNKRLELIIAGSGEMNGMENVKAYVKDGVVTVCGIEDNAFVTVTDAAGRMLYSKVVTSNWIDCELPAHGVYMITVRGEKPTTVKVVY